jgi:hypothetical protein
MNASQCIFRAATRGIAAVALLMFAMQGFGQADTVEKISQQVSGFLDQLANVKCTEKVEQQKLSPSGKVEEHEASTFDYLMTMSGSADELSLSESRLVVNGAGHTTKFPLLVTNGFSTLFLVFHPYYRNAFRFVDAGEETLNGQSARRIRFEHISGQRTPIMLAVRGREFPLDIVGTAWILPETGTILRIDSALASPMDDIGLRTMSASILYAPVHLPDVDKLTRFPVEATIEVETRKQRWRNIHRFSDYKEFTVTTTTDVKATDEVKK